MVATQTDLDTYNIPFKFSKVDWGLCTHVTNIEEIEGGILKH